jgi:uncharacterized protein YjbJ (UPF0337 family)
MSLIDIIRDKAAELFSGAGEKITEVTGVDLPGAETAGNVADSATATGQEVTDAAQGLGDTATGTAADLTGTASDRANDAIADVTDPPRPM